MKKSVIAVVVVVIVVIGAFVMRDSLFGVKYKDGVYTGEAQKDFGGMTSVTITIKDNKIVDCVLEARDDNGELKGDDYGSGGSEADFKLAQKAVAGMRQYPAMLIETQNIDDVEAVSGATVTHKAMQFSVRDALKQAQ